MSTITTTLTAVTEPIKATAVDASSPTSISLYVASQEAHDADISDNFVPQLNAIIGETNIVIGELNTLKDTVVAKEALMNPHYTAIDAVYANETDISAVATDIIPNLPEILQAETNAATASAAAAIAIAAVNYKGDWISGYETTGYSLGMSVSYTDGYNYTSKINNNLVEPTTKTNTAEWNWIEAIDPSAVYTKSEADTLLSAKVNTSDLTELTQDTIGSSIVAGTNISVTYNDTTGQTTIENNYTASLPIGSIAYTSQDLGDSWLFADGQQVLFSDYPELTTDGTFAFFSSPDSWSSTTDFSSSYPIVQTVGALPYMAYMLGTDYSVYGFTNFTGTAPTKGTAMSTTYGAPYWITFANGKIVLINSISSNYKYGWRNSTSLNDFSEFPITYDTQTSCYGAASANDKIFVKYYDSATSKYSVYIGDANTTPFEKLTKLPNGQSVNSSEFGYDGHTIYARSSTANKGLSRLKDDGWYEHLTSDAGAMAESYVAYGRNGNTLVAINTGTANKTSYVSTDNGLTWTAGSVFDASYSVVTPYYYHKAYIEYFGGKFIAIGGIQGIKYSSDGLTWTGSGVSSGSAIPDGGGYFINNGTELIAMINSTRALKTTDATSYIDVQLNMNSSSAGEMSAIGNTIVMGLTGAYYGAHWVSTDAGVTWTKKIIDVALNSSQTWKTFGINGYLYLISNNKCYRSTDGLSWTDCSAGVSSSSVSMMHYDDTLGMYFIMNTGTTTYFTSTNGTSWTQRTLTWTGCDSIASKNGVIIATDDDSSSNIYRSLDGISWTTVTNPFGSSSACKIHQVNGLFIMTNNATAIATSTDGTAWAVRVSSAEWIYSFTYKNGVYYGLGNSRLQSTTNFDSWTTVYTNSSYGVTSSRFTNAWISDTEFISFSSSRVSKRNTTNTTWTDIYCPSGVNNKGTLHYFNGKYVYANLYQPSTSTDLYNWEIQKPYITSTNATGLTGLRDTPYFMRMFDGTYFWQIVTADKSATIDKWVRTTDGVTWEFVTESDIDITRYVTSYTPKVVSYNGGILTSWYGMDTSGNNRELFVFWKDGVQSLPFGWSPPSSTFDSSYGYNLQQGNIIYKDGYYYSNGSFIGGGACINRSTDGKNWETRPVNTPYYSNVHSNTAGYFDIVNGKIFCGVSDSSSTNYLQFDFNGDNVVFGTAPCILASSRMGQFSNTLITTSNSDSLGYYAFDGKRWDRTKRLWSGTAAELRSSVSKAFYPNTQSSCLALATGGTSPYISATISKSSTAGVIPVVDAAYNIQIKVKS